jgi:hypothetical protein
MNLFELREWVVWTLYVVVYTPRNVPGMFPIYKPIYINECFACMDIQWVSIVGNCGNVGMT